MSTVIEKKKTGVGGDTIKCHCTPTRMAVTKKTEIASVGKDVIMTNSQSILFHLDSQLVPPPNYFEATLRHYIILTLKCSVCMLGFSSLTALPYFTT